MTYVLTGPRARARLNERASGLQEAERDGSDGHREVKKDFCRYHTHSASVVQCTASTGKAEQVLRVARCNRFFSHGLSGAILQGPPLRPRVQCCPPPSFWLEWGANHLPPLPTLSFQRIDADTAGQPRRSDTRQGNRPQGLSAARLPSTRLPARVVLEQNVSPFEPLPPDSPSHSQRAALEFLSGRTLDLLCAVYSGFHHQWWRARLHAAAQHGTAPP